MKVRKRARRVRPPGAGTSGAGGGRCLRFGAVNEGAVVEIVTVTLAPEALGVTELGENWQVASEGTPLHARFTAWLKPPILVAARVYVAVPPGETVADDEEPDGTARLKS
jgi:hypothetical protein